MSKHTINKAHLQQKSLASKLWQHVKRHFHKVDLHSNEHSDINDATIIAIQQDLALIDENLDTSKPQKATEVSKDYAEFEVEITLEELQDALNILESQNQKAASADETLNKLVDTLKTAEKGSKDNCAPMEVIVEFIPLSSPANTTNNTKTIYREIQIESMSDKLKREKEQRELAKRITHYPPSDRLH